MKKIILFICAVTLTTTRIASHDLDDKVKRSKAVKELIENIDKRANLRSWTNKKIPLLVIPALIVSFTIDQIIGAKEGENITGGPIMIGLICAEIGLAFYRRFHTYHTQDLFKKIGNKRVDENEYLVDHFEDKQLPYAFDDITFMVYGLTAGHSKRELSKLAGMAGRGRLAELLELL